MSWLEAEPAAVAAITPEQAAQVGTFLARLHQFSASYQPPAGFERPRLDWTGLFSDDSIYASAGDSVFSAEQVAVMRAVAERVRETMQALDAQPDSFGLIHGDFIAKNVLFSESQVCALDFEYCAFGYYLYDLAPALLGWNALPAYADLKAALWETYSRQRPQVADQAEYLETLVAGRHVASCRWIASNLHNPKIRNAAPEILAQRSDELRGFLATGQLLRESEIF
jgi:Ser/Thr protein kinase RdoA (MazF antagonist)